MPAPGTLCEFVPGQVGAAAPAPCLYHHLAIFRLGLAAPSRGVASAKEMARDLHGRLNYGHRCATVPAANCAMAPVKAYAMLRQPCSWCPESWRQGHHWTRPWASSVIWHHLDSTIDWHLLSHTRIGNPDVLALPAHSAAVAHRKLLLEQVMSGAGSTPWSRCLEKRLSGDDQCCSAWAASGRQSGLKSKVVATMKQPALHRRLHSLVHKRMHSALSHLQVAAWRQEHRQRCMFPSHSKWLVQLPRRWNRRHYFQKELPWIQLVMQSRSLAPKQTR